MGAANNLENAPALVTRAELHSKLWPEGVFVDRNHGLNKFINRLRLVLADDPSEPRFIETLSRRGYRFIAEVERVPSVPQPGPAVTAEADAAATGVDEPREAALAPGPAGEPSLPVPIRVWWRRSTIFAIGVLAVSAMLLVGFLIQHRRQTERQLVLAQNGRASTMPLSGQPSPIVSVVVETGGGLDPPDTGFRPHIIGNFNARPLRHASTGGVDRLEITSDDQGYFYRPLSPVEKDFALSRDWALVCVCAVKAGGVFANLDFGKDHGNRFDILLLQEDNVYYVALTQQISPTLLFEKKIKFMGAGDVDHPHTYELRYNHQTRTASLWIDGELEASNYHGEQQFREDRGVMFGAFTYPTSKTAVGVFRTVRFEVH